MRAAYRAGAGPGATLAAALLSACAMALLGSCALAPASAPAPVETRQPQIPPASAAASAAAAVPADLPAAEPLQRPGSRWMPARFAELPGWGADRSREFWPALQRSCELPRPAAGWERLCQEAQRFTPADDAAVRAWLEQRLRPYRVEAADGQAEGLATGYFEPLVEASRTPRGAYRIPLHGLPADLGSRRPYWTRQQLDSLPAARASVRGREIAYVADPLDALLLQVQGSGRLRLVEPDGRPGPTVRLAYAGHNDHPYKSVGRTLIDWGELRADQASWPAIRDWARRNPARLNELLWSNPRTVFFREEALPDPSQGPRGAQGVPLTPGRSIAVDARSIPYGTPVWIDTTEPLSTTPLQRLVMAQDTGSAIVGAVRADYFWGWGEVAEQQAGRMKQGLRMWVLVPRG